MFLEVKIQLTKLGGNKVLRSWPRVAMLVVSFVNFNSRALSRYLSAPQGS